MLLKIFWKNTLSQSQHDSLSETGSCVLHWIVWPFKDKYFENTFIDTILKTKTFILKFLEWKKCFQTPYFSIKAHIEIIFPLHRQSVCSHMVTIYKWLISANVFSSARNGTAEGEVSWELEHSRGVWRQVMPSSWRQRRLSWRPTTTQPSVSGLQWKKATGRTLSSQC